MRRVLAGFLCITFLPLTMVQEGLLQDTCYGKYGCLKTDSRWYKFPERPVNVYPQLPEEINTTFTLYTRNKTEGQTITEEEYGYIDCEKEIKVLVHGFLYGGWMNETASELLKSGDLNVLTVDWLDGAQPPYTQATANTRVVGLVIAYLINYLVNTCDLNPGRVHIIGHSLGAHVVGYVGERVPNLGRITGLDPARPYFEGMPDVVRLDQSDATFVDIIHTDSCQYRVSFGMFQRCGHLDFYPNGGCYQPGCQTVYTSNLTDIEEIAERLSVSCNHDRAYVLFTKSINNKCLFIAHACEDYEMYTQGECSSNKIALMGYRAQKEEGSSERYFLETSDKPPYCCSHKRMTQHSSRPTEVEQKKPSVTS